MSADIIQYVSLVSACLVKQIDCMMDLKEQYIQK